MCFSIRRTEKQTIYLICFLLYKCNFYQALNTAQALDDNKFVNTSLKHELCLTYSLINTVHTKSIHVVKLIISYCNQWSLMHPLLCISQYPNVCQSVGTIGLKQNYLVFLTMPMSVNIRAKKAEIWYSFTNQAKDLRMEIVTKRFTMVCVVGISSNATKQSTFLSFIHLL